MAPNYGKKSFFVLGEKFNEIKSIYETTFGI